MKIGIMKVHKKLQDMEIDDRYADYEVLSYNCSDKLKGYHYQREKMSYLYPSGQLENMDEFDYFLNDWQLYLEYQLSEWLLSKSEEIH